jgi:hypothetical protein
MGTFWSALTFPFKQRGWIMELLITIIIAAIPVIGFLMIKGWEFEISTRVRHKAPRLLPGWRNIGNRLMRGLLVTLALFIYNIPFLLLVMITVWFWISPVMRWLTGQITSDVAAAELGGPLLGVRIGLIIITAIVWFIGHALYWSGYLRYIETRRYSLFFDLVPNAIITFNTIADDLLMTVYLFGAQVFAGFIETAVGAMLTATGIGAFLVPFVVPAVNFTFMSWVRAYLYAEMAEGAFGEEPSAHPRKQLPSRSSVNPDNLRLAQREKSPRRYDRTER